MALRQDRAGQMMLLGTISGFKIIAAVAGVDRSAEVVPHCGNSTSRAGLEKFLRSNPRTPTTQLNRFGVRAAC